MKDSLPFARMGLLLVIGYSAAFMVLFNDESGGGDYFDTFPRSLETLFHAGLGNFRTDVSFFQSYSSSVTIQRSFPGADASPCW